LNQESVILSPIYKIPFRKVATTNPIVVIGIKKVIMSVRKVTRSNLILIMSVRKVVLALGKYKIRIIFLVSSSRQHLSCHLASPLGEVGGV
jgi:hypothetical protein